MLTQHTHKTAHLSPDYTFAIRELGVWSGDETIVYGALFIQSPGFSTFLGVGMWAYCPILEVVPGLNLIMCVLSAGVVDALFPLQRYLTMCCQQMSF